MNIHRIFDILEYQLATHPLEKSIEGKRQDQSSYSYSTQQIYSLAHQMSLGLMKRGVGKGDKIAMISYNNRPEWNVADFAMQYLGVVNVPVYPTLSFRDYVYIFNHAAIRCCIVGHRDLLDKVIEAQAEVPSLEQIFTFDPAEERMDAKGNPVLHWEALLDDGDRIEVEHIKHMIEAHDLATLIYTSGTTGDPKGVMLTHRNILSNVLDLSDMVPLNPGEPVLSFLPLCHSFERTLSYTYMYKGLAIHYPLSLETIGDSLQEVRPYMFTAVPRLLEKMFEKIQASANSGGRVKRWIFAWADKLSDKFEFDKPDRGWRKLQKRLLDRLVYSKIRKRLGGRIQVIAVGASACPSRILKFFCHAGIPIREGYGLTESAAALTVNRFESSGAMLGTVGQALPGVQLKIEDEENQYRTGEGEILARGACIMQGYYKEPEKNAEVFDEEGWFQTGDIGILVQDKAGKTYLKITDRKKELLKTSGGKYIAPTPIESKLRESRFISQAMVVGEKRKFVSALIVPELSALVSWCQEQGVMTHPQSAMVDDPVTQALFQTEVDRANQDIAAYEQVKKITILAEAWSVETGELTPTLKMKRKVIEAKFQEQIAAMYESENLMRENA